jgi:hypothetical protein
MSVLRRIRAWLRSGRKLAVRAAGIATDVAHTARAAGWDVRRAVDFLRASVRQVAHELGLSDKKAEAMIKAAERELGHRLLLAAIDELDEAIKGFKMPDTERK